MTLGALQTSATLTADDNVIKLLTTTVSSDTLIFATQSGYNFNNATAELTVQNKSLNGISLVGSGNIKVTGVAGGAQNVQIMGSGNITLSGTADSLTLDLSGSGNFDGTALSVKTAVVTLSASGNITLNASEKVTASKSGSGVISNVGTAAVPAAADDSFDN